MKIEWDLVGKALGESFWGLTSILMCLGIVYAGGTLELFLWTHERTLALVLHTFVVLWILIAILVYNFLHWERHDR